MPKFERPDNQDGWLLRTIDRVPEIARLRCPLKCYGQAQTLRAKDAKTLKILSPRRPKSKQRARTERFRIRKLQDVGLRLIDKRFGRPVWTEQGHISTPFGRNKQAALRSHKRVIPAGCSGECVVLGGRNSRCKIWTPHVPTIKSRLNRAFGLQLAHRRWSKRDGCEHGPGGACERPDFRHRE